MLNKEAPSGETKISELKTTESQTHGPQPHESQPHASSLHDSRPDETQVHGHQAHESLPYRAHKDQASTSEGKAAQQNKKAPEPPNKAHTCAWCHKHPAPAICNDCEGSPDGAGGLVKTTAWCSPICQIKHHPSHNPACLAAQARRKLYEAGTALQAEYHGYCQGLIYATLGTESLDKNIMIIHEKDSTQHTTNAIDLLFSLRKSGNRQDKRAYLACLVGSDFTETMSLAIKQHLRGT